MNTNNQGQSIKILFVGVGEHPMYEKAFYDAACKIQGIDADIFTWLDFLTPENLYKKIENKFIIGTDIIKLNNALVAKCEKNRYDIVFLYTCRIILYESVEKIKAVTKYLACYCNDNPFSDKYPKYFWRHWQRSLKYCDVTYVYRKSNIEECRKKGAGHVELMMPYYIEERNFYIPDEEITLDVPDVVFLGHYENDERVSCLELLCKSGIKVGIRDNKEWDNIIKRNDNIVRLYDTFRNYNLILNKAKICLVFLSKINNDTYTRRCFEIPSTKTMMLSVYTDDLANIFEDNKEAVFFKNPTELLEKVQYYLLHDTERINIANSGYKKLMEGSFSAKDRVQEIILRYKKAIFNEETF